MVEEGAGLLLFRGLKVIDCGSYIAAPAAATVLSDFGAEIIKIEPLTGDLYRIADQPPPNSSAKENPNWFLASRNKKSLAINLATEQGHDVLLKLASSADIFITNFPLDVRRRLRMSYADITSVNSRIIYASFTGYGETGPEANKKGFDATVWWARSGMMDLVRTTQTEPMRGPFGMGDHCAAMALYSAIVTALYRREKTGKGSHVGSSLLASGFWANACAVQNAFFGDFYEPHPIRDNFPYPGRNSYRCRDGKWLVLSLVNSEDRWRAFRDAVQSPLLDDARFRTSDDRKQHGIELTGVFDRIFAQKDLEEWTRILNLHGIVFGPVRSMRDIPNDQQARNCGVVVETADGSMLTVSSPFWIEDVEKVAPRPAPKLGEHNQEVLATIGLTESEIQKLRTDRIVS